MSPEGKATRNIKLIYIMLTDSLRSIIGVNIIEKMSLYFRKHS